MKNTVLKPKLDYVTLKGCYYSHTKESLLAHFFNFFSFSIEDCFHEKLSRKDVYYFKQEGIDFKFYEFDFEIEFHSTFFARYGNPLQIMQGFSKEIALNLQIVCRPIRIDVARDVLNYDVGTFLDICSNPGSFQFSFKGRSWCREVKSGKVETVYLHGPKSRWKLCVYDKTKELKDNWSKMTEDKKAEYEDYLDKKVTRFELRVRSEFIKNNVLTDFYKEEDEEELCLKILGSWSKRRTIYKKKPEEVVTRNNRHNHACEDIFLQVFKTDKSSEGTPSLVLESTKLIYDQEKIKKRIANVIARGESVSSIDSFELGSYLRDARLDVLERESRYRESFDRLSALIVA